MSDHDPVVLIIALLVVVFILWIYVILPAQMAICLCWVRPTGPAQAAGLTVKQPHNHQSRRRAITP